LRYPDRLSALLVLAKAGAKAERGSATRREKRAYACANCGGWHLTSRCRWTESRSRA